MEAAELPLGHRPGHRNNHQHGLPDSSLDHLHHFRRPPHAHRARHLPPASLRELGHHELLPQLDELDHTPPSTPLRYCSALVFSEAFGVEIFKAGFGVTLPIRLPSRAAPFNPHRLHPVHKLCEVVCCQPPVLAGVVSPGATNASADAPPSTPVVPKENAPAGAPSALRTCVPGIPAEDMAREAGGEANGHFGSPVRKS